MVTILLGPPGVGKGTQGLLLAKNEGWMHVSTGDLLRAARREGTEPGRKAQGFMDAGELVPDALILDLVREHLEGIDPQTSVIFDGFPRTVAQAEALSQVLDEAGREVDRVVLFEADDDVLVKRISGRRSSPSGRVYNVYSDPPRVAGVCDDTGDALMHRPDDDPDTVRRRLEVYQELTAPLIDFYAGRGPTPVRVDADRGVDDVQAALRTAVGGLDS